MSEDVSVTEKRDGLGEVLRIAAGVALGVLMAALVLWLIGMAAADISGKDECPATNSERAEYNLPPKPGCD